MFLSSTCESWFWPEADSLTYIVSRCEVPDPMRYRDASDMVSTLWGIYKIIQDM